MSSDSSTRAKERLLAIAKALNSQGSDAENLPTEFVAKLKQSLLKDPSLPPAEPSISLWQQPVHPRVATLQSITLPAQTDFVVIGSGITGCSVAKALLESQSPALRDGAQVTVLEARTLVSGATGRNGGHLVTPVGHTYGTLVKRFGVENAQAISRFSILNIDRLMDLIKTMNSDIQMTSETRELIKVMVARDQETWDSAKQSLLEFQAAVKEHEKLHCIVEKDQVEERWGVTEGFGAIEHRAGAIWPYRFVTGVFEQLLAQYPERLSIETNTPATDISHQPGREYPYSIQTPRGMVRAKQVIHCTNGHGAHLLRPLIGCLYPFRGTMSVQKSAGSMPNVGNNRSWSGLGKLQLDPKTGLYQENLFYMQQNGKTGDYWVGTEISSLFDTISGDDSSVSAESMEALLNFLPTYFKDWPENVRPQIKGIWTGIQGHTSDGLPLVGRIPTQSSGRNGDGEWIAGGYNGYGMDKAWMTGEALVRMIEGEDVPSWFPKCFLITEERLQNTLTFERGLAKWYSIAKTGDWK